MSSPKGAKIFDEEWRPIVGYEGAYEISNRGRVRSLDRIVRSDIAADGTRLMRGRILKPSRHPYGYDMVSLSQCGEITKHCVHVIACEAFHGPRPAKHYACHYDGDPTNNRIENLRWATPTENNLDAVRHGTHHNTAKTHCSRGHEFTPENIYINPSNGSRQCRICIRKRYLDKCSQQ